MLLFHKHTDVHLKQNRHEIVRVPESYLRLNRIVCNLTSGVHVL